MKDLIFKFFNKTRFIENLKEPPNECSTVIFLDALTTTFMISINILTAKLTLLTKCKIFFLLFYRRLIFFKFLIYY